MLDNMSTKKKVKYKFVQTDTFLIIKTYLTVTNWSATENNYHERKPDQIK